MYYSHYSDCLSIDNHIHPSIFDKQLFLRILQFVLEPHDSGDLVQRAMDLVKVTRHPHRCNTNTPLVYRDSTLHQHDIPQFKQVNRQLFAFIAVKCFEQSRNQRCTCALAIDWFGVGYNCQLSVIPLQLCSLFVNLSQTESDDLRLTHPYDFVF